MLALEVGISEDELRELLSRLIAQKAGWRSPRTQVTCLNCESEFEISTRRARIHTVEGSQPRCPLCSRDLTPGPSELKWIAGLPPEIRESAVAAMAALAA
ncbi:MAG TPA: hypothetical protein VFT94_03420 [Gaiellaceae bacterium]|nr:hypothetical protein [Gaiellaceae bacterium]